MSSWPSVMLCRASSSFMASSAFLKARLQQQNMVVAESTSGALTVGRGDSKIASCWWRGKGSVRVTTSRRGEARPDDDGGPDRGQNEAEGTDPS